MSKLLALDIGTRRTGVAYADTASGIVMALETIKHSSDDELTRHVATLVKKMKISELIIGLPKLLDGSEGKQSLLVRSAAQSIVDVVHLPLKFVDERFTSGKRGDKSSDKDARAACAILTVVIDQRRNQY
jgi:putative Holliday junction resolvase